MTLAYNGTTAGSTLANPPVLLAAAIGGHVQFATTGSSASAPNNLNQGASGGKLWFYSSSNSAAELAGLNAFSDGVALGMTYGDIVIGVTATGYTTSPICFMGVIGTSVGSTGMGLSSNVLSSTNQ